MPSVVGREARFQRGENFFLSWKKKKVSPFCFFPLSAKLAICLVATGGVWKKIFTKNIFKFCRSQKITKNHKKSQKCTVLGCCNCAVIVV